MKDARPPYIDRETYESFKKTVKKEKNGRIRDTLKEEIEKALIFYDKCGKDLHCLTKDKMIEHLDGVEWRVVVDVDATQDLDIIEEFKKQFKNVYSLRKITLERFISDMTGRYGNYTYRKYAKKLVDAKIITYDYKDKKFYTCNEAMGRIKETNSSEVKAKELDKAKKEADKFFGEIYDG